MRRQITAATNKLEAYNGLVQWVSFGDRGIITSRSPIEQEKRIKYNDLVANALILQNVADMTAYYPSRLPKDTLSPARRWPPSAPIRPATSGVSVTFS